MDIDDDIFCGKSANLEEIGRDKGSTGVLEIEIQAVWKTWKRKNVLNLTNQLSLKLRLKS